MQGKTMYHQSTLVVVTHDLSMLGACRDWSKAIFSDMSFSEIGQIIEGMMYWLGITGSLGGPQGLSLPSTCCLKKHPLEREICVVARTLGMEQPRPYPLQCRGSHSFA